MLSFIHSNVLLSLFLVLTLSLSLNAQRYKSFDDFIYKNKAHPPPQRSINSASSSFSLSTTPPPPITCTPTTHTQTFLSKVMFIVAQVLEFIGGVCTTYILGIGFKYARNGFHFKTSWIKPKFHNYHVEETEENNDNNQEVIELVVLGGSSTTESSQ